MEIEKEAEFDHDELEIDADDETVDFDESVEAEEIPEE